MSETALQQRPKRTHPHRKDYTEREIESGLLELLICHGNRRRASAQLAERGISIPPHTLRNWKEQTHATRYEELRLRVLPRLQKRMAAEAEDLVGLYADVERLAVQGFRARHHRLDPKDMAKAAQQFAVARGISTEKALLLRGQPTSIIESRPAVETLREIRRRLQSVDSTAEEISDAEVVSDALPAQSEPTNA